MWSVQELRLLLAGDIAQLHALTQTDISQLIDHRQTHEHDQGLQNKSDPVSTVDGIMGDANSIAEVAEGNK